MQTCKNERIRFLRDWEMSGSLPHVRTFPHFQECHRCQNWYTRVSAAINTIAVPLTREEERFILIVVRRRIGLNTTPLSAQPLWREWLVPVALSSALFGIASALFVQHYADWMQRVIALYLLSLTTDVRFASGILLLWELASMVAIWTALTFLRLRYSRTAAQNRNQPI